MTSGQDYPTVPILATLLTLVGVSACGAPPQMSVEDHAFDKAISAAMAGGQSFAVTSIEPGSWSTVCVVGEQRPAHMLPGHAARPGEEAFDSLFDAAAYWTGPSAAFAFVYDEGVEVRPLNGLHVNMGQPINRCVSRAQAILVSDGEGIWRFRDFPAES